MRWILAVAVAVVVGLGSHARAEPVLGPTTVVYVVDRAMPVEKLEVVTRSLSAAVDRLHAEDTVAVIAAGVTASVEAPLQSPTARKKNLLDRISRIRWSERSNVEAALGKASALFGARKDSHRHVVLVTASASVTSLEPQVRRLRGGGARVSIVAYQTGNATQLAYLAGLGGGRAVIAQKPKELGEALYEEAGTGVVAEPEDRIAVVLVLDRSGSMSGPRIEAAKESARTVAEVLAPSDVLSVIAFDSEAQVVVAPQRATSKAQITSQISRITPGGGTNIYPGLKEAFGVLQGISAPRKVVILLSDGEAPYDGIPELVQDMRAARITVNAVGLQGADRNLLSMIADTGDGRLYLVEDLAALPKIFLRATRPDLRPPPRR